MYVFQQVDQLGHLQH